MMDVELMSFATVQSGLKYEVRGIPRSGRYNKHARPRLYLAPKDVNSYLSQSWVVQCETLDEVRELLRAVTDYYCAMERWYDSVHEAALRENTWRCPRACRNVW